jgi:hypothetical protein
MEGNARCSIPMRPRCVMSQRAHMGMDNPQRDMGTRLQIFVVFWLE